MHLPGWRCGRADRRAAAGAGNARRRRANGATRRRAHPELGFRRGCTRASAGAGLRGAGISELAFGFSQGQMRILHVISSLDPAAGGVAEVVRLLLRYGPEGYAQEVVTLDDPRAPFLGEIAFTVHALGPTTSVYSRTSKLIPWLKANRARFDGVVVHGMWQYCGYAVWRTMGGRVALCGVAPWDARSVLQACVLRRSIGRSGCTGFRWSTGCCAARIACCLPVPRRPSWPRRASGCTAGRRA